MIILMMFDKFSQFIQDYVFVYFKAIDLHFNIEIAVLFRLEYSLILSECNVNHTQVKWVINSNVICDDRRYMYSK